MIDDEDDVEIQSLLDGLRVDAAGYFNKADEALEGAKISETSIPWGIDQPERLEQRDQYWSQLPEEIRSEAKRLDGRLVSLMGQVARAARGAQLSSEADQRDVLTGAKAMRAALRLRRFRTWDTEILNDEDVVLGITPAGQSDDKPFAPNEARVIFDEWMEKTRSIVDLMVASPSIGSTAARHPTEAVGYRPGTAFIMMWMDQTKPELNDVSDAVKEVFENFDIRAIRADDIEHEGLITERILREIKISEFCFADLSGSRPNVYYEVGFAHALSRRVILFRKAGTGLHFDLAGYNCPEYSNLGDLKKKLTKRLRALTNKEPKE